MEDQKKVQKTCGECSNYFKAYFNSDDPSYYSEIKRSCLKNNLYDLEHVSSVMGLTKEQDPLLESCTHFEPKEEEEEKNVIGMNIGFKKAGKKGKK